jgi:hypothetical protein
MSTAIEKRMITNIITPKKAAELIKENGNKFFWTAFVRKNDKKERNPETGKMEVVAKKGTIRYMNCQTGVKKYLRSPEGVGRKYNFKEHGLQSVYDRKAKGYRSFAWDYMVALRIKGNDYVVLNENCRQFCKDNPDHPMAKLVASVGIEV